MTSTFISRQSVLGALGDEIAPGACLPTSQRTRMREGAIPTGRNAQPGLDGCSPPA